MRKEGSKVRAHEHVISARISRCCPVMSFGE